MGARIKAQRIFCGYSRELLAEKVGITPKFCADIELGTRGMSVETLCRFSAVLHLSTDWILFGTASTEKAGTGENEAGELWEMLRGCPPDKIGYGKEILKQYLLSQE